MGLLGYGFVQIKGAKELLCVVKNVTDFLEMLQSELHPQGQWSLCLADYDLVLLGRKVFQPREIQ